MPTYKFKCSDCKKEWEATQPLLFNGERHKSSCPECEQEVESFPTGGTGVLMKGKRFDKYLEGFPDFTADKNKKADEEGKELERKHDAYIKEQTEDNEKQ